jgi:uncharacterized protein (TIGR02246 family)
MCWLRVLSGCWPVFALPLMAALSAADDGGTQSEAERAIRAATKAYFEAVAKGDSKAVAEFWMKDGDFIDDHGDVHPASELATEVAHSAGAAKRSETRVTASKVRLLTADVAVDDGTSQTVSLDDELAAPIRGHFHATWVKRDGQWRLASLCETAASPDNEPRLSDLDWMVGRWTSDNEGITIDVNVQWNSTRTFLLRDTKATREGNTLFSGSQRIGWDPLTRKLKSWSFESDGGYGEATWVKDGESLVGQNISVMPDGRQISATTIITRDGNDVFTRKVIAAKVDGEPMPDQQVRYKRQASPAR